MEHPSKSSPRNESVSLRAAVSADIPALVRLINAAFLVEQFVFDGDRINTEETRAFMDAGQFLLAEDAAGFGGCVYLEIRQGHGYLGLLAVDPARQGRGLGSKLVSICGLSVNGPRCHRFIAASVTSKSAPPRFLLLSK